MVKRAPAKSGASALRATTPPITTRMDIAGVRGGRQRNGLRERAGREGRNADTAGPVQEDHLTPPNGGHVRDRACRSDRELLGRIDDCRNGKDVGPSPNETLAPTGHLDVLVIYRLLTTAKDPAEVAFAGFPTITLDGEEPFPSAGRATSPVGSTSP